MMTKQEALDAIREMTDKFPKEAVMEIQANREIYIPELLDSLDYTCKNATKLTNERSDYNMHTYAMCLLAEFREKQAFPFLLSLLRLTKEESDYIYGDSLGEYLARLLLSTFDHEKIQLLFDIIENTELYLEARTTCVMAYGLLINEGIIASSEGVAYLRNLIYDKLPHDDSSEVFTYIVGCAIDCRLLEMIPDVRFLYENHLVDESYHGNFDYAISFMYVKEDPNPSYIDDTVSEMSWWACFNEPENYPKSAKDRESNNNNEMAPVTPKIGRNDPCPCGSGKKYKKCCLGKAESQFL
jgi:hypothetical protein